MHPQQQPYIFPLHHSFVAHPAQASQFMKCLEMTLKTGSDNLLCEVFPPSYVDTFMEGGEQVNLDMCYIQSGRHLVMTEQSIKGIRKICPIIPSSIFVHGNQNQRTKFLSTMIGYGGYLGLKALVVDFNQNHNSIINSLNEIWPIFAKTEMGIWMNICLTDDSHHNEEVWRNYVYFMRNSQYQPYVRVILQVQPNIDPIVYKWKSENVQVAVFQHGCFVNNSRGYPVLPHQHEILLEGMLKIGIGCGVTVCEGNVNNIHHYTQYFRHAYEHKTGEGMEERQREAASLMDYRQYPLQPYADNLSAETYSVFEFDAPKYDEYELAFENALERIDKKRIVMYYIGAGRGQLLFGAFRASKRMKKNVFIYAVEKNPFPIQTLKKRIKDSKWENKVKVVHTDIREYQMPEEPDIFFSELLGAFGDNELSPECLLWAEKNIAEHTICIPQNYIAYVQPISYQKVHSQISEKDRHCYFTINLGRYYAPFASKDIWKFQHPLKLALNQEKQLEREGACTFEAKEQIVINGFAGYFTSQLFGKGYLSIRPEDKTFSMYSWFPLFFPFTEAAFLQTGDTITILMSRKCTEKKVWYEWSYERKGHESYKSTIHNKNGETVAIYL